MTEQYTQSKNKFYVDDAYLNFNDVDDEDPEVTRVNIDLLNNSNDSLHLYPKKQITHEKKVNGMKGVSQESVNHTVSSLPDWIKTLIKQAGSLDKGECIVMECTAQVNEYDDGNKAYRVYQNMLESDSFEINVEEFEQVKSNPENAEEDKERSEELAEDFAEDQTNIENEDEEIVDGSNSEDVLFGESDE